MLNIHMFSSATKVKGQGVGSAYLELIKLLRTTFPREMEIKINDFQKSDISHYHTVDFKFYLSTFTKKRGCKVGYVHFLPETLEGSLKLPGISKTIFNKYLISFYKRMDQLVVVNPSFIPKLMNYGIPEEKITYIPNFVAKSDFYPKSAPTQQYLRKQHGFDPNKFIVLGVGQIQERKGVADFIELARRMPDVQFVWVGGFSFGRITDGYAELKKKVDNPLPNLFFPGIVDREKMNDYYNMADLFLLPSYNELFPMSILEAFSSETPVLVRDLELYHAVIADYYLAAQDCDDMEVKIRDLQEHPEKMQDLQQKAQAAANYYSEERLAKIWLEYYQSLSKGK